MALFISVPNQSKYIEDIKPIAETHSKEEVAFSRPDASKQIAIFKHTEELWNHILSLEPIYENKKPSRNLLSGPSPLEIVTMGYPNVGE